MGAYQRNRANIHGFKVDEVFGNHKANERVAPTYAFFAFVCGSSSIYGIL